MIGSQESLIPYIAKVDERINFYKPRKLIMILSMRSVGIIACLLCYLITFSASASTGSLQTNLQRPRPHRFFGQEKNHKALRQQDLTLVGLTGAPDLDFNVLVLPLWKARTLLMVVAGLYGLDNSVCKLLQRKFMPEVISTLKYSLAAVYFLPSFIRSKSRSRSARVGVELGLWCTIYAISISHALMITPASKVSFFASLGMILAPIYDIIFPDKTVSLKNIEGGVVEKKDHSLVRTILRSPFVAPLLAIMGVLIMECKQFSSIFVNPVSIGAFTQNLRLLVSPLASSLCYWRASRLSRESEQMQHQHKHQYQHQLSHNEGAISAVMLATVGLLCGAVCFVKYGVPEVATGVLVVNALKTFANSYHRHLSNLPWSVFKAAQNTFAAHGITMLLVLVSSLLATGWSTLTEQRALRVVSAAQVSVLLSLEPLFATFFAYLLLGENVGTNTALAAVFIVTASLWGPLIENFL